VKHKISRRDFLKGCGVAGLGLGLASIAPGIVKGVLAEESAVSEGLDIVAVKGDTAKAVRAAVETLGGIAKFVSRGDKVIIKPNMSFPNPAVWGTTTSPEVVVEIAKMCLEAGAKKVLILDHPLRRPEICLAKAGIKDACGGLDDTFVFVLAEEKFFKEVNIPQGESVHKAKLMKDVLESDVLINVPTAKSHMATGVSLGLKGMMGLIWDRGEFHRLDLNRCIVDLNTIVKRDLTIIDCTRALVTGGPGGPGEIEELSIIVAGIDPVAVDSYVVPMAKWYGRSFSGSQVKHIVEANDRGLGEIDISKLKVRNLEV